MANLSYRIVGDIGLGGVAKVQKALCSNGTMAVLRILQMRKMLNFRVRKNFMDGAAARAKLSPHPNIVGSFAHGGNWFRPYELIEFVEGNSLRVLMGQNDPVVKANRLSLLKGMAAGLAWVHANGLMHLDVKPENFLIGRRRDELVVKLTDFDMARKSDDNAPHPQYGTPAYMAPEQFKEKRCYQASDVFAFGLVAYYMLTGCMPFTGKTPKMAWRNQASSRTSARFISELVPNVDPDLEEIVMRCLAKPLSVRYANMGIVAGELLNLRG